MEIHGTSRADMNGKRGVATDFHVYPKEPSKWRYTVQLDSGEAFKVKPANVREGAGGDEGSTKAKGKRGRGGKKRRGVHGRWPSTRHRHRQLNP